MVRIEWNSPAKQKRRRILLSVHCTGGHFATMSTAISKAIKSANAPNQQQRPSKYIHAKSVPGPSQKWETLGGLPNMNNNHCSAGLPNMNNYHFTPESPKNHAQTMTEVETYQVAAEQGRRRGRRRSREASSRCRAGWWWRWSVAESSAWAAEGGGGPLKYAGSWACDGPEIVGPDSLVKAFPTC